MNYITLILLLILGSCTTCYHLEENYLITRSYGYDTPYEVDTMKIEVVTIKKTIKLK